MDEIREIHRRRYLLQEVALEVFLTTGLNYLLVFSSKAEMLNLFEHLERALDQSGFLRNKAQRPTMVRNLRVLLQRAEMTEQEARTFHGVIKFLSKGQHEE